MKTKLTRSLLFLFVPIISFAQGSYKQPPKDVMDVLNAPAIPSVSVSPVRDRMALLEPLRYPPIAELAQPMLRLAGVRVNPNTNGQHRQSYYVGLKLKNIPDGKYIAAGNITPAGVELWIIDAATGKASKIKNVHVNTAFGGFSWEDSRTISALLVPA